MIDPDEDAAMLTGIAQGMARCLGESLRRTPDLIEGFLAGRYALLLAHDGLLVVAGPEADPHLELDLPDGE